MSACVRCVGTGKESHEYADTAGEIHAIVLSCEVCDGTGSREQARLLRARRQGWRECEEFGLKRGIPLPIEGWKLESIVDRTEEEDMLAFLQLRLRQARATEKRLAEAEESKRREMHPGETDG
jgi:superfamily I DNA/RNA helicase